MSSSYVRSKVRQWCNEVSATTNIPFYDTVNVSVRPPDPVWFTVAFVSEFHEGNFCSPQFVEHGFISVVFVSNPGIGDTQAVAAVEAAIPLLFAKSDVKLTLVNYEPLVENSAGSADKDYRLAVTVNYRLSL